MPQYRVSWEAFPVEAGSIDVEADDKKDAEHRASRILSSDIEEYITCDLPKDVKPIKGEPND